MDNFNYPMGADNSSAPWNQKNNTKKEFDVYVTQTLNKVITVHTNDYIEGAVDWESEYDEDGNRITVAVPGAPDTSNTDWKVAFDDEHYSALELIQELRRVKKECLRQYEIAFGEADSDLKKLRLKKEIKEAQRWIAECEGWDEEYFKVEEN